MSKLIDLLKEGIPFLWAVLWVITITVLSFGGVLWSIKWLVELLGVV